MANYNQRLMTLNPDEHVAILIRRLKILQKELTINHHYDTVEDIVRELNSLESYLKERK
jgi:hypothetical protein